MQVRGINLICGLLIFLTLSGVASAQQFFSSPPESEMRPRRVLVSGIISDRLSSRDLRRWSAIKAIVFATDRNGKPRYPTLRGLWGQVDGSGHAIYIELRDPATGVSSTAGAFRIEEFDPQGIRHVAVIRLYLPSIDRAYVGPRVARENGFIPFEGLSREERYAEVLGHELAHADWILGDLERARLTEEMIEQTNQLFELRQARDRQGNIKPELRQRLIRRDKLLAELEAEAEAVEFIVWQELSGSKKAGAK